ncbi:hypothetical protein [Treponema endosymbiont of Eucomonympha sp.]|uniref:hypothetical protein n=1 Tax=Treponema endosymbiont of Eucomonympha sp. TaxID=1580831 RepID=UPI00075094EA|nr:hypothetical protein [Treponema endosymbiont of Eucomonympha sp.]
MDNTPECFRGAIGNRGKSARNQGRKLKIFRKLCKDNNTGRSDMQNLIRSLISMPQAELLKAQKNKNASMIELVVINTLLKSHNRGLPRELFELLEAAYGKELPPAITNNLNISAPAAEMTPDERKALLDEYIASTTN